MNIGEYKVTTERSENSLYRWVEAVNTQKEKTVIIQILQPGISPEITAQIVAYFDTLQAIRRKNLWLPEQVFSNADYPLVLVYPYLSTTPLGEILQASTEEEAIEWWHQASETLHTLHNKNIVHGCIALDSFVVVERSVCLTGFGYAPFLQMGEPKAIQECREVVAPEVLADHYLTSAADIYGFAKTVANWQPQLLTTTWYSQAANPNPEFRYPRIRDCFQALQETLLRSIPEEYNQAQRTKTSEDAVETESNHQHQDIIPKYILEAKVEPSEAGEVCGGGSYSSYPEPKSVLVKAQPLAGWNFDHWSGDIEGEESSVTLTMNCDKLIVAYFVPSISPTESDNSTRLEQEKLESEKKARLEAERKLKVKEEQERQRVERERIEKEKLEATPARFLRLLRKGKSTNDRFYPLSATKEVFIGREPNCTIVLDSRQYRNVSRRHAVIRPFYSAPDVITWEIWDLNSANGTYVNGQRIRENQSLQVGDRITLGHDEPEFIFESQRTLK